MSRREVMDASAVLALLQREPGAENVELQGAVMNSVNFAEVVQKTVARERPADTLLQELTLLGLSITSFSPQEAQLAGELYRQTKWRVLEPLLPTIPTQGYLTEDFGGGLYHLTNGTYQMMFLTTGEGVIVVDAPSTLGQTILRAIREVTDEPITHVVYSHSHADHIGAAVLYPENAVRVAHEKTARLLLETPDPNRPLPTITFSDHYELRVGNQLLELT